MNKVKTIMFLAAMTSIGFCQTMMAEKVAAKAAKEAVEQTGTDKISQNIAEINSKIKAINSGLATLKANQKITIAFAVKDAQKASDIAAKAAKEAQATHKVAAKAAEDTKTALEDAEKFIPAAIKIYEEKKAPYLIAKKPYDEAKKDLAEKAKVAHAARKTYTEDHTLENQRAWGQARKVARTAQDFLNVSVAPKFQPFKTAFDAANANLGRKRSRVNKAKATLKNASQRKADKQAIATQAATIAKAAADRLAGYKKIMATLSLNK